MSESDATTTSSSSPIFAADRGILCVEMDDVSEDSGRSERFRRRSLPFDEIIEENVETNVNRGKDASEAEDPQYLRQLIVELRSALNAERQRADKLARTLSAAEIENHDVQEKVFEEGYRMVNEEKALRMISDKRAAEAQMKLDLLEAEVSALKTAQKKRSFAHRFLSPVVAPAASVDRPIARTIFGAKKPRSISATRSSTTIPIATANPTTGKALSDIHLVDPLVKEEFDRWKAEGFVWTDLRTCPLLNRIVCEDIQPCLSFANEKLASDVWAAIQINELEIERIRNFESERECALTQSLQFCPYRMRLNRNSDWEHISVFARNRLVAICDLYIYACHLKKGLLRSAKCDAYWHLLGLRRNIVLSKLGLPLETFEVVSPLA